MHSADAQEVELWVMCSKEDGESILGRNLVFRSKGIISVSYGILTSCPSDD